MELISAENGMSPTWSPDGQAIAFLSNRAEGWDLYTMPSAGGAAVRLTSGATADDPAWSPDGQWIAVERRRRIEAVRPDGADRRLLTADGSCPTWSPNLNLAFIRDGDLYQRTPAGEETLLLRDADQPHWSPDGRSIAFVRRGIWTLELASGAVRQRTQNPADEAPALCADGDLLFIRHAQLLLLHPNGAIEPLPHLPTPAGAPAPHPLDLDTLAFQLHDGGNWDIVTASLSGGAVQRLTRASWASWNARL